MNEPVRSPAANRGLLAISMFAALVWLGALAFSVKWLHAWSVGRLEPGSDTSGITLFLVFAVALLASLGGVYLSVRAWRGRSTVRWQVSSLAGAIIVLWAVCGG